ncbi:protein rolling stone-like, partial [Haliotis rubra]|uniref:protein rolling stone-like n=1 Tax=Haliotis rubra TaxID=36100 RepID=UPI001EE5C5BB
MFHEASQSVMPLIRRHLPPDEKRSDSRTKCSMEHWREQFRCSSFGLEHPQPHLFTQFEWGWPKVYLCWRAVAAVYHVAVIIVTGFCDRYSWTRTEKDSVKWFIYLTNWMFFQLTLSTLADFMALGYCHLVRKDIISGGIQRMPLFLKVTWVLHNLSNTGSILVTILFWGFVHSPGKAVSNVDFITHTGNTTYVILNLCIAASPVRFLHFFQPLTVAATYSIFSA